MQYPVGMIVLRIGQKPVLALKDFFQSISSKSILTEIKKFLLGYYQLQNEERKLSIWKQIYDGFRGLSVVSVFSLWKEMLKHIFKAMFLHL